MAQSEDELSYWFIYRFRNLFSEESDMGADREQAIRELAYALWEHDGRPAGRALDYWLRAEAELSGAAGGRSTGDGKPAAPSRVRRQPSAAAKPGAPNRRTARSR